MVCLSIADAPPKWEFVRLNTDGSVLFYLKYPSTALDTARSRGSAANTAQNTARSVLNTARSEAVEVTPGAGGEAGVGGGGGGGDAAAAVGVVGEGDALSLASGQSMLTAQTGILNVPDREEDRMIGRRPADKSIWNIVTITEDAETNARILR